MPPSKIVSEPIKAAETTIPANFKLKEPVIAPPAKTTVPVEVVVVPSKVEGVTKELLKS